MNPSDLKSSMHRKTRVLAVVAHPDDEIIGPGGTLCQHAKAGHQVEVLILGDGKSSRGKRYVRLSTAQKTQSDGETTKALAALGIKKFTKLFLPDNSLDTVPFLDIVKQVSAVISEYQPTAIYTHHSGDLNVDHRITNEAVVIASRPIENGCVQEIYTFETLSSTEMSNILPGRHFHANTFVNIEHELSAKLEAMKQYASELRPFPHPRSLPAIEYNALLWGAKNNIPAAEAFCALRVLKSIT